MSAKSTANAAATFLGTLLIIGAVWRLWPSMLGWLAFLAFTLAGIWSISSGAGFARKRVSVAFAVYMWVCAIHFGVSFGNTGLPRWSLLLTTAMLLTSVAWFMREARRTGSGGKSAD